MDILGLIALVRSKSGSSGGTTNYNQLTNKPSINNVQLSGNKSLADFGAIEDVQINGTSILEDGVANIPVASSAGYGVCKVNAGYGIGFRDNILAVQAATTAEVKAGANGMKPITPSNEHTATFYGLAKAAGDATQSASANAVGAYTEDAKSAINTMLGSIQAPANPASGAFLVWNGTAWVAQTLATWQGGSY